MWTVPFKYYDGVWVILILQQHLIDILLLIPSMWREFVDIAALQLFNPNVYSEIYQACRWNEHPIYQAVMTRHDEEVCDVQSFNSRQCYRKNGKTICQCKFHVYSNVYYIYPNIVSFKGLDECLYAKVTPLYNPWQYASIMKRSLPLYIEEGSYILGTYEDIPVTSIITRVGPPPDEIIQLNDETNIVWGFKYWGKHLYVKI